MAETAAQRRARWLSVSVAPSATPTRRGGSFAAEVQAREERWARDMPAYKRLVDAGHQPPNIDGCADLEANATHPEEIKRGRTFHPEALRICEDAGVI